MGQLSGCLDRWLARWLVWVGWTQDRELKQDETGGSRGRKEGTEQMYRTRGQYLYSWF